MPAFTLIFRIFLKNAFSQEDRTNYMMTRAINTLRLNELLISKDLKVFVVQFVRLLEVSSHTCQLKFLHNALEKSRLQQLLWLVNFTLMHLNLAEQSTHRSIFTTNVSAENFL
jgi:hypothetical protein